MRVLRCSILVLHFFSNRCAQKIDILYPETVCPHNRDRGVHKIPCSKSFPLIKTDPKMSAALLRAIGYTCLLKTLTIIMDARLTINIDVARNTASFFLAINQS